MTHAKIPDNLVCTRERPEPNQRRACPGCPSGRTVSLEWSGREVGGREQNKTNLEFLEILALQLEAGLAVLQHFGQRNRRHVSAAESGRRTGSGAGKAAEKRWPSYTQRRKVNADIRSPSPRTPPRTHVKRQLALFSSDISLAPARNNSTQGVRRAKNLLSFYSTVATRKLWVRFPL